MKTALRALGAAAVVGLAVTLTACGGSSNSSGLPTVTMMVGGIDKQIYLPYQLADGLGLYKKFWVDMQLSTEQQGGVGAEDAVASGQVDMAGAWYVHTINFQQAGKNIISVAQLSGAPGERVMCAKDSAVHTPADFKGKTIGVTDLGSGTDDLTLGLAAHAGLPTKDFSRLGVGAGSTLVSALQQNRIQCAMTTEPTVTALQHKGVAAPAIDIATTAGAKQWFGGVYPGAAVLAQSSWIDSHKKQTQAVVNALVAAMHYIATHSATDIADHLPPQFVSNGLITKPDYIAALQRDKDQFLPDGMMPAGAPQTALAVDKDAGHVTKDIDLSKTYTDAYVIEANKTPGVTGN